MNAEDYKQAIRNDCNNDKELIKQHTTDFFEPAVHLTFEENE